MTYELLRERICEILPDLKELTFGCGIEYQGQISVIVEMIENHPFEFSAWWKMADGVKVKHNIPKSDIKILGKDPSLADILRAIGKNREIFVGSSGNFYKGWNDWNKPLAEWNLTKNLSGQSPEVCEFLGELLK